MLLPAIRVLQPKAVGAHKTSMLVDVEHGRSLELEALVGSVLELARITGTPVPTIEALYAVVKLLEATLASQGSMLRLQPRGI